MFRELGQFASLMKNLPRIREEMEKMKQQVARMTAEGDAGGGMVRAKVNGHFELLSLTISDEAMRMNDKEMLEDLIRAAVNQAVGKARELMAEETGKMAMSLGLPQGADLGNLLNPGGR
jgi:nucleoid-associated protein EbfC